jgi:uncharacterized protein (TIGR02145 family)
MFRQLCQNNVIKTDIYTKTLFIPPRKSAGGSENVFLPQNRSYFMSKTVSKFAFTAGLVRAMACTFSCDSGGGGDGGGGGGGGGSNCTADFGSITIGSQVWAKKNLNCDVGVSKCYDNDPANCTKYGRLYDWNTAKTACPKGWHLPSDDEWTVLENFVGGGNDAGEKLKSTSGWNDWMDIGSGNGTDEFGFSALPGGCGNSSGSFDDVGDYGYWWSANDYGGASYADGRFIKNIYSRVGTPISSKSTLYSVRCVKD